jgi:hypothetical protein
MASASKNGSMSIEGDGKHDPSTQRLSDTVDKAQSRVGDWAFPWVVLAVCAAIGLFVVVCLTAVSAEIYDDVMEGDGVASFDQPVLDKMIEWRTPIRDEWVTHFTDLGST